jgi:hypothetical protein
MGQEKVAIFLIFWDPKIYFSKNEPFGGKGLSRFFYFRVNTPNPFPESGSGKRFQSSRMRSIDSPHKITLLIFRKNKFPGPKQ